MINCLLISEDIVFTEVIHRLIKYNVKDINFKIINSFTKYKNMSSDLKFDLLILDDSITGAAENEIITDLKFEKHIDAPTYFFSTAEYFKKEALESGADFFYKKPFKPEIVAQHILSTIKDISKDDLM